MQSQQSQQQRRPRSRGVNETAHRAARHHLGAKLEESGTGLRHAADAAKALERAREDVDATHGIMGERLPTNTPVVSDPVMEVAALTEFLAHLEERIDNAHSLARGEPAPGVAEVASPSVAPMPLLGQTLVAEAEAEAEAEGVETKGTFTFALT